MIENLLCTCYVGSAKCNEPATHRYRVLEDGDWYYLCFEHWGMTAIARVTDKDSIYTKTCERLADILEGK